MNRRATAWFLLVFPLLVQAAGPLIPEDGAQTLDFDESAKLIRNLRRVYKLRGELE